MSVMENSMPQFLESFSEWQNLMERAEKDKNADIQEILRSIESTLAPLKECINKIEREYFISLCLGILIFDLDSNVVAFQKAENVDNLLAEKEELPKPQKSSKPRGGNNRRK
jgi:hypothetical protein